MSFLDMDERLIDLLGRVDLVFSPLMDVKEYPEEVDLALVEGAVANEDHLHHLRLIRARTRVLVSFGDCAVNGNVTALRNPLGSARPVLEQVYREGAGGRLVVPQEPGIVPPLLDRVRPIHEVVPVDFFLPGCPPSADLIGHVMTELAEGRTPDLAGRLRYG
jgi:NAD-reducing hydrogenase small subunit